jgi:predicted nucleic acid-binding protein
MRVLCDTNLLVRSVSEDDPDHHLAVAAYWLSYVGPDTLRCLYPNAFMNSIRW